jgi:hypothetical protein
MGVITKTYNILVGKTETRSVFIRILPSSNLIRIAGILSKKIYCISGLNIM